MGTLIVMILLGFIVFLAIRSVYRNKKHCNGSCGSCGGSCHHS